MAPHFGLAGADFTVRAQAWPGYLPGTCLVATLAWLKTFIVAIQRTSAARAYSLWWRAVVRGSALIRLGTALHGRNAPVRSS
jgi:hypothetical protein